MVNWLTLKVQHLNWTTSQKLFFFFSLLLTLFVINGSLIFLGQWRLTELDTKEDQSNGIVQTIQDLRRALKSQNDMYADAIFITDKTITNDNFGGEINNILVDLRQQEALLGTNGMQLLNNFASSYREITAEVGKIRILLRANDLATARELWPAYTDGFKAASAYLDNLYKQQLAQWSELSREKSNLLQASLILIAASTAIGVLVAGFLVLLFNRSVGRPLQQIEKYLDEVAGGNLTGEIIIENRDELGRLAQALNRAIANLRQVINGVQVGESLMELAQTLNSNSHHQASGSHEQLSSVTQIIATMHELTQHAKQISANASLVAVSSEQTSAYVANLKQVAERAGEMATRVQIVVGTTVSNISEVNINVDSLSQELSELTSKAQEISKVIDMIKAVSEEVNLLALNAAIEAAGAGEYGERFGVVAAEVKNLAIRTKDSTGHIAALINSIQQAINAATWRAEQTNTIARSVARNNQQLENVAEGINNVVAETVSVATEIYGAAEQVDNQVDAIKVATQEQMTASLEVQTALQSIGEMARENAVASQSIATSTNKLDTISANLVKMLAGVSLS